MKKKQLNWHRIFGITLMDYFTRTGYDVELEVDQLPSAREHRRTRALK